MNIDKLFEKALQKGITDVQVFLADNNQLSIDVFNGEVDKYEIADTSSLVIKGIFNGKMGTYVTEVMEDDLIDTIIENIILNAKIVDSLDDAIIYEGDSKYEALDGLFNEELFSMDVKRKIDKVKELDQLFHNLDSKVTFVESMYSETTRSVLLQNTKGLKLYNKVNSAYFGGQVIVKDETDQRTAFDLTVSNEFVDFDSTSLAKSIVESGVKSLGAKPIPSKNYEIVFDKDAFAVLLSAFENIFSAEAVQKGLSLLKGKLHQQIGSKLVTIVDDPFMKKSSSSRSFDDEGVATFYKELIKEGQLDTYLHNLISAKRDNVKSTGNGFGGSISPINLKVLPGNKTQEELIASVKDGIFITNVQGAHAGANPISGDFSLQAMGFVIENGVLGKPVALITVAGNFIEMLLNIVEIANDLKTGYFGITCPSIKVKSMPVSGI
ncbi:MAG: TldD/PmbA family protein [Firmicutes bacterium]|nr:TldD/PmbA family protein [Bacillota bacterium]